MPQNTSKKKNNTSRGKKKVTHKPKLWPYRSGQMNALLSRQRHLSQTINHFGCVTKLWRLSPKQCSKSRWPHLVEINQKIARSFVVESLNPNLPLKTSILSSFPYDPNGCNEMALTGMCSPAFAFCRYRWVKDTRRGYCNQESAWTVQNCTVKEPYAPNEYMKFTNAIAYQGKFYVLSLQGSLVVIEDIGSCFEITAIGANRAVPLGLSRQFREYLVELDGNVLLVLLVSRKSINVVDDVQVFRLDVAKLLWVRVGSIGDKALFLEDECCVGVTAREVGCQKNCIFFTHLRVEVWRKFDMESGLISSASHDDDGMENVVKLEVPTLEEE